MSSRSPPTKREGSRRIVSSTMEEDLACRGDDLAGSNLAIEPARSRRLLRCAGSPSQVSGSVVIGLVVSPPAARKVEKVLQEGALPMPGLSLWVRLESPVDSPPESLIPSLRHQPGTAIA